MRIFIVLVVLFCLSTKTYGQNTNSENLFDFNKGARVVDYSSNYGGNWDANCVLENYTFEEGGELRAWCTEEYAKFPHFVTVELKNSEWLNIIDFNNNIPDETSGWEGISAKDVEVYVSTKSKNSDFINVVKIRLENNKAHQIVKINPIQAKWVKFVITSNYGHESYTEFGQIGVYDDKQRNTKFEDELTKNGFVNLYGLYFDFGSDVIKNESQSVINQIVDYMKNNPDLKIQIEGHTDNIGSNASNQTLSEKRAIAVKNELVKKGVSTDRLSTKGFGSSLPISSNDTNIGRAQNRRVTVRKI